MILQRSFKYGVKKKKKVSDILVHINSSQALSERHKEKEIWEKDKEEI